VGTATWDYGGLYLDGWPVFRGTRFIQFTAQFGSATTRVTAGLLGRFCRPFCPAVVLVGSDNRSTRPLLTHRCFTRQTEEKKMSCIIMETWRRLTVWLASKVLSERSQSKMERSSTDVFSDSTLWVKKRRHYTLVHIFAKYWPIFTILSLTYSVGTVQ